MNDTTIKKGNINNKKKFTSLRELSNWAFIKGNQVIDKPIFEKESILNDIESAAPKAFELVKMIKLLDEQDMEKHGKKFKHFIFSDVKTRGHGAKILSSVLTAIGYNNLITVNKQPNKKTNNIVLKTTTPEEEYNSFAFLTSSTLYKTPPKQGLKKRILKRFNKRPDNIYGKDIRIIILDSGFKEGIDLFDVKYVHLYDKALTSADKKQAIGRATRFCGQSGLPFEEGVGWILHVYSYETIFSDEFSDLYEEHLNKKDRVDELILDYSSLDKSIVNLGNQLYDLAPYLSVDYDLNKSVHFPLGEDKDIIYEDAQLLIEDLKDNNSSIVGGGKRGPNKGYFDEITNINCSGKCGKKSTRDIPATISLLKKTLSNTQPLKYKQVLRDSRKHNIPHRNLLCELLKTDKQYCQDINEVWRNRYASIPTIRNQTKSLKEKSLKQIGMIELTIKKDKVYDTVLGYSGKNNSKKYNRDENKIPDLTQLLTFKEMRDYISTYFNDQKWDDLVKKNMCSDSNDIGDIYTKNTPKTPRTEFKNKQDRQINKIIKYTPTQDFVRKFLTPCSPYKGLLLWHSVGTGKTCSAIATASTSFEREGYTILWVTRNTLKSDVWKNIFDKICHDIIAEEIRDGKLLTSNYKKRKQQLLKNWFEPMSYKQFTNLLMKKNDLYNKLLKRNGSKDILHKTLVIIDEAHKLYSSDLKTTEKPDMKELTKFITNSYEKSGNESVKLLLLTATPFTDNPMELFKMINLLKPDKSQHITEDIKEFKTQYFNKNDEFTNKGKKILADKLAGYISYLDRSKDISQFATPVQTIVKPFFTAFTNEERHELYCSVPSYKDYLKEHKGDHDDNNNKLLINELKDKLSVIRDKVKNDKKNKTRKIKECREKYKGRQNTTMKNECIQTIQDNFNRDELENKKNIDEINTEIKILRDKKDVKKEKYKTMKKALLNKRKTLKNKNNQERAFQSKFIRKPTKYYSKLFFDKNKEKSKTCDIYKYKDIK